MPAKSKSNRVEFHECVKCHCIVHSKDLSTHVSECSGVENHTLSHAYVKDAVFHGVVSVATVEPSVPKATKKDVVLVHPSVMSLCGLSIGQECIIQETHVGIAWPSSSSPSSQVALTQDLMTILHLGSGDHVTVQSLTQCPVRAGEARLKPKDWKQFYEEEDFINYLKKSLYCKCLRLESEVCLTYFGQICQMKVIQLTVQTEDAVLCDLSTDNITGLTQGVDQLNLSDMNESSVSNELDSRDFCEHLSSTPNRERLKSPKETPGKESSSVATITSPQRGDDLLNSSLFQTPVKQRPCQNTWDFYRICSTTKCFVVRETEEAAKEQRKSGVTFQDIGGMSAQIAAIRETVMLPLKSPHLFSSSGLPFPRGILLFGPSGTGKSMLIQAMCNEMNIHTATVSTTNIISKFYGESEARLRNIFKEAEERAPSIIVMDDIDSMFANRDKTQNEALRRLVSTLLTLMDGIVSKSSPDKFVMVLAATVRPESLDPALRRPGRLDREVEVGVPTAKERLEILEKLLSNIPNSLGEDDRKQIADTTHGYVGADILCLCQQANINAIKREIEDVGKGTKIKLCDVTAAMTTIQPSAMREIQLEIPKVHWSDIGGQEEVKLKLKQAVEWPLRHPEAFSRMGITPPRGILMYGPPGCSKTMIAKALATESGLNFLAVKVESV